MSDRKHKPLNSEDIKNAREILRQGGKGPPIPKGHVLVPYGHLARLLDEVERLKAERARLARALDTIGRPAEHHGGAAHCEACADVAPALTLARRILSQDKEEG